MSEMTDEVLSDARDKMQKARQHTLEEFSGVRTGRASPAFVEKLQIDYYGSDVPLQQIAGFAVPEARLLVIQPYDASSIKAIEKAIQNSDLGVNPSNDGKVIRLAFPPLTAERRKDYVKMVKQMAEEGRVAIRNARRAARHDLEAWEKEGEISADELERAEKELEKLTHAQIAEIDSALEHKEKELTEV
ncbi:MAG TPA: ribosome recycling factor [Acidimicrobiales bacterium]|nr:ribosome recycling factor [Acidimicrobiales bacterium]